MPRLLRLAAGVLTAFAITFLLSLAEPITPNPAQPAILAVVLAAAVAGVLTGSGPTAALSVGSGTLAAFVLAIWLGISLYNPSPTPSDLYVVRLMLIGISCMLSAGVGYVSGKVFVGKAVKAKPAEVVEENKVETAPAVEKQIAGNRVCKFCGSIIPAESIYCPMCGTKLVEE
jgi:predicted membrane channel-forming protein YqfA (hemolysin III family)